MNPYLSVIITNYNEEENLKHGVLDEITDYLDKCEFTWDMVLVDDGSTDRTQEILKEYCAKNKKARLILNQHMGKAAGIITGALQSKGEIVLFTDTDQSTPISEFAKFIPEFKKGADIVIGSRSRRQGAPLFRQVLAYGMVLTRTIILNISIRDTQCGFKAFTRKAAETIFTRLQVVHPLKTITVANTNPGFDLEVFYLARKLKIKVAEVPVLWTYRESKRVSFIKDAVNGLKELFLVRWRSITNAYKI